MNEIIGTKTLHYNIIDRIGQGGMGVVYKAEDTKLKRIVALKFLTEYSTLNSEERQRFENEAQSAASLNHPNIATIYTIEELDDNVFIVMEYIEGVELKERIKSALISIEEAINIALQIAEGIEAAHQNGIVHRDIKSQNIMITKERKVKIMDFGLARMGKGMEITKIGTMVGTVANMSPEQARGLKVDNRTDIWSFGVVLYEMLTGKLPFMGDYDQAVIYSLMHEKHTPASELRTDIPMTLNQVIDRCLQKEPRERFEQAGLLIEELQLLKQGIRIKNQPQQNIKSIAVFPFLDINPDQNNKYFSDGLTEEIIAKLSKLNNMKIISSTSAMNYNRTGKTMKEIASDLDIKYVIEGSIRKIGDKLRITTKVIDLYQDTYLWANSFNGTTDQIFDFQEEVATKIAKALKITLTPAEKLDLKRRTTKDTEAYQYYLKGRFFWNKRSIDGFKTAIKYFEKAIELDNNFALAWSGLADAYNLMVAHGAISKKEIYPKALSAVKKALELDNRLSEAHTSLASLLLMHEWDWQNSLKEFKLGIKFNPNYATAHHWYSEWLSFNGKFKEALAEISEAIKLDPLSAITIRDKGMIYYYSRDYDSAIEYAMKALELDSQFSPSFRLLSLAYLEKGMYLEAIENNEKWTKLRGESVETIVGLGLCYARSGRKEEALQIVKNVSQNDALSGNAERGIALIYAALEETDLTIKWLEKTFQSKGETICLMKIDPKFDSVRNDPRFIQLLKEIGLK
jgi:serine/threonine protein kinase/Tfp pilus assembly protein PilF